MAKSSALKKLKEQKTKRKKPASSKKAAKPKKESKKVSNQNKETPSVEDINSMKVSELDKVHDKVLSGELAEWADMNRDGKREALIEALHGGSKKKSTKSSKKDDKVVDIKSAKKSKEKKATKSKTSKKASADDQLTNTVHDIENLTEDQADDEVHKLKEDIEYNYFRLGGVLAVIKANKFIGEYKNFREKVEADFGMKYRKAEYLISIYNNITESGVDWDAIRDIGWTKLKYISHLLTPENVDEWVEKAMSMNQSTLEAEAREVSKSGGKSPSKKKKSDITSMTFKVHDDQRETIEEALEKAKEEAETDVNTVAFEYICLEYLSGGKKKVTVKKPTVKQFFEQVLEENDGNVEEALGVLLEGKDFKKVFGCTIDEIGFED